MCVNNFGLNGCHFSCKFTLIFTVLKLPFVYIFLHCRISAEVTYQKSVWGFVRSEYPFCSEIMCEPIYAGFE